MSRFRMIVVCLALLLEGMSTSGINVQIGAVHADLILSPTELHLVPSAFLIAYAGLLPVAGTLADRIDRRRVFLLGIALFGVGCLVCAAAPGPWALVVGRFVQGAGAALSAPAALALITAGLPEGAARNRAVALYGAMGAVGFSLGLVLPGAVVTAFGWRWSFAASLPAVLLVLAATWTVRSEPARRGAGPDLRGAVVLTAALMVAVHLLGAFSTLPAPWLAGEAAVLAVLVVRLVVRGGVRDLPRTVVANPRVQAACLALGGLFAGVVASMYALSLAAHAAGHDAIVVALLVVPQPIVFSLTAAAGARLVTARGPALPFAAGALLFAASIGWLAVVGLDAPAWAGVLPAMAGVGAALGLCFPAASVGAVDATPAHTRGTTAGVLTTAQNTGGALGIAVLSAVAVVPAAGSGVGVEPAMAWSCGLALAGLAGSALLLTAARRQRATALRGAVGAPCEIRGMPDRPDVPPALVERLRGLLEFPECAEEDAWTGVRWRVRKATVAHVFGGEDQLFRLTFRADPQEVRAFEHLGHPYFRAGWGGNVVGVVLDDATDWDELAELLTDSYCIQAPRRLADGVDRPEPEGDAAG